jgi:hypothetical protein
MQQNFAREIEYLLSRVPKKQWKDPLAAGLRYQFVPWYGGSSVTLQTREDDPRYFGDWKYYVSAESDCSRIRDEMALYQGAAPDRRRDVYHRLLVEAAEALLGAEIGKYIPDMVTTRDSRLYHPFSMQVYDADGTFKFNYCEYVLARRLDAAEPSDAPARGDTKASRRSTPPRRRGR